MSEDEKIDLTAGSKEGNKAVEIDFGLDTAFSSNDEIIEDNPEGKKDEETSKEDESKSSDESDSEKTNEEEKSDEPEAVTEIVKKLVGFNPVDENNVPIVYDDTDEGIAKLIQDRVEYERQVVSEEAQNKLFKEVPQLKDAYDYISKYGSLDGYGVKVDYNDVVIGKDDINKQLSTVIVAEMKRGRTEDEAIKIAEMFKDGGMLLNESENSLKFLKAQQEIEDNKIKQQKILEEQTAQQEFQKVYSEVNDIISKGEIDGFKLPLVLKRDGKEYPTKALLDYVFKPVKDGYTQEELDLQELSLNARLLQSVRNFVKFDDSQLIKSKVAQDKANTLRSRVQIKTQTGTAEKPKPKNEEVVLLNNISN